MKQKKVKTCEIQSKLWNNNAEECFKEVQIGKKMSLQNKASNFQLNFQSEKPNIAIQLSFN